MQRSIYKHIILDTIQVTGDDVLVKNRHLYVNNVLLWKFDDVDKDSVNKTTGTASVTPGVLTYSLPLVPVNSTQYSIQVTVANPGAEGSDPDPLVFNITVTTAATGTLANTDLATQFANVINAAGSVYQPYFSAVAAATLELTAETAYPVIIGSATSPITVTQSTQGTQAAGTPALMADLGVGDSNTIWASGTTGTLAGTVYDLYYAAVHTNIGETNTARVNQGEHVLLWVNQSATNRANFETALENVLKGGTKTSATTSNTDTIEVDG